MAGKAITVPVFEGEWCHLNCNLLTLWSSLHQRFVVTMTRPFIDFLMSMSVQSGDEWIFHYHIEKNMLRHFWQLCSVVSSGFTKCSIETSHR